MTMFHKFLILLWVGLFSACASKELQTQISRLETENQVLKSKLDGVNKDLAALSEDVTLLKGRAQPMGPAPVEQAPLEVSEDQSPQKTPFDDDRAAFFEEDIASEGTLVFTNEDLDKIQWGKDETPKPLTSKRSKAQADYELAYQAFQNGDYPTCRNRMQAFVDQHPKHDLTDNAHFWIGETYYIQKDYQTANMYFKNVIRDFPKGNKVPDAMLRSANCSMKLSQMKIAKQSLEILIQKYPKTVAAAKAKKTLETIK